jgi:hypothetical protein
MDGSRSMPHLLVCAAHDATTTTTTSATSGGGDRVTLCTSSTKRCNQAACSTVSVSAFSQRQHTCAPPLLQRTHPNKPDHGHTGQAKGGLPCPGHTLSLVEQRLRVARPWREKHLVPCHQGPCWPCQRCTTSPPTQRQHANCQCHQCENAHGPVHHLPNNQHRSAPCA